MLIHIRRTELDWSCEHVQANENVHIAPTAMQLPTTPVSQKTSTFLFFE